MKCGTNVELALINFGHLRESWASLVAQMVKKLLAMQETQVQSLGWEDPLEKGITTHSSILAWRITWTEESGGLQYMGLQRIGPSWVTKYTHNKQNKNINSVMTYARMK